ncbi:signal peptidase I [Candidatus Falkowbacteria bacterium HGW-Falkowbacteria-2]|uniref:Signal peptidase I n=1 Tax=Candidatus Falkowbacteria bacterium HGW-Falkowbacteria-2 TaxID=2013769 RepID=A0A2N2E3W6_9BACT|nr:MAG: signal peptidase I [Candidatus Falkowbacteria bacterium HGW-Falkowbacteria-2]
MKIAYSIFVSAYLLLTILVIIFSSGMGRYRFFTNISGSMEPAIDTSSLCIAKEKSSYQAGEIIVFQSGEDIITHRIVLAGDAYRTKGDANLAVDGEPVYEEMIIGKVVGIIPGLGTILAYIKSPLGTKYIILLPAGLIVLFELYRIYKSIVRS